MSIFTNNDNNLPKLPKIKKTLPKLEKPEDFPSIKMTDDQDMLFDYDGKSFSLNDVADKFSDWYLNFD